MSSEIGAVSVTKSPANAPFPPVPARSTSSGAVIPAFHSKNLLIGWRRLLLDACIIGFPDQLFRRNGMRPFRRAAGTAELTFSLLLFLANITSTQTALSQSFLAGGNLFIGVPQGEFKGNVDRAGIGGAAFVGIAPRAYAYLLGVEFGFMNYGTEHRREPFSTTIPDVTVDVETQNNFVTGHLIFRLQPNTGLLRPYLEGAVGGNYLFTRTTIENQGGDGEEIASSTNLDDFAFSYGGGGGVQVTVFQRGDEDFDIGFQEALIDLRVRYLAGAKAEYLKEGSIRREAGRVVYDIKKSTTDLLSIQVGVAIRF